MDEALLGVFLEVDQYAQSPGMAILSSHFKMMFRDRLKVALRDAYHRGCGLDGTGVNELEKTEAFLRRYSVLSLKFREEVALWLNSHMYDAYHDGLKVAATKNTSDCPISNDPRVP